MNSLHIRLSDLRKLKGSLVYTLTRNGVVIYIGRSNIGIDRPLDNFHPAMSQGIATDFIRLDFCKSASEAAKLERRLIQEHRPALNIRKPKHKLVINLKGGGCP